MAACPTTAEPVAAVAQAFNIRTADVQPIRRMVEEILARVASVSSMGGIPVPVARLAVGALRLFAKAPLQPEHLAIATADYAFDIAKAPQVLGWEPKWGKIDAVVDTYRTDFQS